MIWSLSYQYIYFSIQAKSVWYAFESFLQSLCLPSAFAFLQRIMSAVSKDNNSVFYFYYFHIYIYLKVWKGLFRQNLEWLGCVLIIMTCPSWLILIIYPNILICVLILPFKNWCKDLLIYRIWRKKTLWENASCKSYLSTLPKLKVTPLCQLWP